MSARTALRTPKLAASLGLLVAPILGAFTFAAQPALACAATDVNCQVAQTTTITCTAPGGDCSGALAACAFPEAFTCTTDGAKAKRHGACFTRVYDNGRPTVYVCPGPDVL